MGKRKTIKRIEVILNEVTELLINSDRCDDSLAIEVSQSIDDVFILLDNISLKKMKVDPRRTDISASYGPGHEDNGIADWIALNRMPNCKCYPDWSLIEDRGPIPDGVTE